MRSLERLLRLLFRLAFLGAVGVLLLLVLLTQTNWGRERVLHVVIGRLEGSVHGELRVGGLSSPGLLRGFTLRQVRILGENGRTFLRADSVRAGISASALLRGDIVLTRVNLWSPRVTLERLPGEDLFNAVSIFSPPAPPDSADRGAGLVDSVSTGPVGRRRTILFRGLEIHEGSVEILTPLTAEERSSGRVLVAPGPDGSPSMRRMSFRDMEVGLGTVTIQAPDQEGEHFELLSLSLVGEVWPDPFRITQAAGELRREGSHLVGALRSLELPDSRAEGTLQVSWGEEGGTRTEVRGDLHPLAMADISFLEDRLPAGSARGPFGLRLDDRGVDFDFEGTELTSPQGWIHAQGGLLLGKTIGFRGLGLELRNLDVAVTDPWLVEPLPLRGELSGALDLDGGMDTLDVAADLNLTDPDSVGTTRAQVSGALYLAGGFGAEDLRITLAPLEWGTLASLSPAMTLRGPGALRVEATGSLAGGMGVRAEATQVGSGTDFGPTRVTAEGLIRRDSTGFVLDLAGELRPLSLTTLRRSFPRLPLTGEYSGSVNVIGPLSDLLISAELETSAGPLVARARFDAQRPGDHYSLETEADGFLLSRVLPSLPEPTRVSGRIEGSGKGLSADDLEGEASVFVRNGEVGSLHVDTAVVEVRVRDGTLVLDSLVAETGLGRVDGGGSFGVAPGAAPGELRVQVRSDSLSALRPFLMEEPPLVLDELSPFERRTLASTGVDLDTLPTAADIAVDGRAQGRVVLRGGFRAFTGEGEVEFQDLRLRSDYVSSGSVSFTARGLPGDDWGLQGLLRTDSVEIRTRRFHGTEAEVDLSRWAGRVRVAVQRGPDEDYQAQGTFVLDSVGGGTANLDELTLRFDSARWNLGGPASFAWGREGYRVRDFRLIRPGDRNMRIEADGFLPLEGVGDFRVEVDQLSLTRLARLAQIETPMEGQLSFQGRLTGPPDAPQATGSIQGENVRVGEFALGGFESSLGYDQEKLTLDLQADNGGRRVLTARGYFPADLRIRDAGPRIPDAPVDITLMVDSFPAATALAMVESFQEVRGAVSGEVHLGGTTGDLAPNGSLTLTDGSALLPALGVRQNGVAAEFTLTPDGAVQVQGSARSRGTAQVTGSVSLSQVSDPGLDLHVEARDFLAVNRRDVQARLSGSLDITKTYRRPRVEGQLTVEQGVLMVEEIARSAEVVDLSDPAFFDVVDTALVTLTPILQAGQNPFLQNLQLSVGLDMAQDSWLRGRDLNVEMAGNLQVSWDRTERDLAMVGDLQAVRGVYSVFGRQFQVRQGTVSFQGTPGINPSLDIQAVNRLRMPDFQEGTLEIIATVKGTLLTPRVSLSSNAPFTIAESDLVSYLIFGRPTYALTSGQSSVAQKASSALLAAAGGATANLGLGLLARDLSSVLARDVGLDYLAISQGQEGAGFGAAALKGTVAATQVEIGQYLTQDIFAAVILRPLSGLGGANQTQFAGLRTEWRLSDAWTLEGFVEDRWLRSPLFRAVDAAFRSELIKGFFLYREWGY